MVEQLKGYINALLANYVEALDVELPQSEHDWLLNDIVSQIDLAAHNMVRNALIGLDHETIEDTSSESEGEVCQEGR